jgi:hypothetical protein
MEFSAVKDEGNHQSFDTGSVRDSAKGKGTPHLIAGMAFAEVLANKTTISSASELTTLLYNCEIYLLQYTEVIKDNCEYNNKNALMRATVCAYYALIASENGSLNEAMRRLSQHYENGAVKYSPNNWRKGQPISRYYDSAMRHLWKFKDGMVDEDHASALLWNLLCIMQTNIDIAIGHLPETLNDFPFKAEEVFGKK